MSEDDGLNEDEYDNDGQSLKRPSLLLSGPYRYQVIEIKKNDLYFIFKIKHLKLLRLC
jgi:hypothetical protein